MITCVGGLIGLQLFWNYQNYNNTVKVFDHDINESLFKAVSAETTERQNSIIKQFKSWLGDPALITITADHNNRDSNTVFYIRDTHPRFSEDRNHKIMFGLTDFREKLDFITPEARKVLIEHFAERILRRDLEKGIVYNYTQLLGDSLHKVFDKSEASMAAIHRHFRRELSRRGIHAEFLLTRGKNNSEFNSRAVNASFRKPYKRDLIYAGFESPGSYFIREMKWVVISSLFLIAICIFAFVYTLKTLLSQQKLTELKDDFVSNMTHELNTPIASIKITAEALKTFQHPGQTRLDYLNIISHQAEKLSDLTSQILNSDRFGPHASDLEKINLYELIKHAIHDLGPQLAKNHAVITFDPPFKAYIIKGVYQSLHNTMTNLIDNALKYSVQEPLIRIRLSRVHHQYHITVSDNGIGIPAIYKDQVFEKFFRVPNGNRHEVKGFGLGLNYVKQTILWHKGSVQVSDNEPYGSIFLIKLPVTND